MLHFIAWIVNDATPAVWEWTAAFTLLVLVPLTVVRPTRRIAGIGFAIVSPIFFVTLWISSAVEVYAHWGLAPLIVTTLMSGVPTVVIAFVLALFHESWLNIFGFVEWIVAALGTSIAAAILTSQDAVFHSR